MPSLASSTPSKCTARTFAKVFYVKSLSYLAICFLKRTYRSAINCQSVFNTLLLQLSLSFVCSQLSYSALSRSNQSLQGLVFWTAVSLKQFWEFAVGTKFFVSKFFKAQMSRKIKATLSSSPVRPVGQSGRPLPRALNPVPKGGKSAATVALSKDASPKATKPPTNSAYGERLALDHPDTEFWVPFDNIASRDLIRYFDSDALPTNDAYEFFDILRIAKPHFVHYRSSFLQPPLEVEHFLYTVYKVASAVAVNFPKPFQVPKTNPGQDLSFYLHLKPSAEVMQALKVHAKGAHIALDASFGIPQVEVRTSTPPYRLRDPLDDSDDENFTRPALGKGKGKPASATRKRARSPSDEESVPKKRQSRRKAKPNNSDADYVANADDEDHDELANDAEEPAEPEQAHEDSEAREDEEEEGADEEDKEEEEEEATPKKAAKGASGGKAKAAPATPLAPVSPLFAGPPSNRKQVKAMPVEQVSHDLVTEASKPPFLNKGPPACTNCISHGHDCKPCITSRTNRCQRCNDGHMVCSRGRTAPELLTSFERLHPVLAVAPSALNTALISLVSARRELDLQWIQLTRMSAQYDQQLQELIDIILQQNDGFDAEYVRLFYEDPDDHEERHRDRYARHPVTPVVHNPKLTVDEPSNLYTRLVPFDDPRISDIDMLPNFSTVKSILQQPPGLVPAAPSHPLAVPLTQEAALRAFAKPSTVAGPSTAPLFPSPGHTLVGPAVPPSPSAAMEGVENDGS
ncbi:hypothetical protein DFH08DRAFT_825580 [Mycena albidolilacea]|uniref:Uncharacterized protein n=1 Tax=Mycena albidolilacea TaxID=1033008 RepID=A0AAD6Z247_9AGAR|nr:hypothetical protein DFH08DRAFT_825580 [Mycena albidolilacea]